MRPPSPPTSPPDSQRNLDNLNQVGQIVNEMVFVEEDLDIMIQELTPALSAALGLDGSDLDPTAARVAVAQALGLSGALHYLHDTSDLVGLMRSTGFLDEENDDERLRTLKALALDKALQVAIDHAGQALQANRQVQVARFKELRERAKQIMWAHGCAAQCYTSAGQ